MPTSPKSDKKLFDVAKPGKAAPNATSRPIIVGHKAMIQDPMVNAQPPIADAPVVDATIAAQPHAEMVLEPSESLKQEVSDAKAAETPVAQEPTAEEQAVTPSTAETVEETPAAPVPAEAPNPEPETKPEETSTNSDSGVVDELAEQAASKKDRVEQDEAQKAKQETFDKIIAEKTYFLPIGRAKHRRNAAKGVLVFIVLILLAAAAANVFIDAGIVKTSIKPVVDIIK